MLEKFVHLLLIDLFQPLLIEMTKSFFNTTIIAACIGALGSIFGGVIGALVAFGIAKFQINFSENKQVTLDTVIKSRYKALLLNEINTNQIILNEISNNSSELDVTTILKYTLSNDIYQNIKSELEVDSFYESLIKYYRVFNRIKNDPLLLDKKNISNLLKEIKYLNELQEDLLKE